MSYLAWLVPIALGMGVAGLIAFLWSVKSGQYDDMDGAAERVLLADMAEGPLRSQERIQQKRERCIAGTKDPMCTSVIQESRTGS